MKALDPNDQLYLSIERRQQPMHVAALQLFSLPEGAGPDYVLRLAEHMRGYRCPSSPFNKRLVKHLGVSFWEEDAELDLDLHLRHEALPHPGRIRELFSLVSAEHSGLLDRERPMWEAHLIEGLSGRRFALYTKVHHSLMDGISGMRVAIQALSPNAEERNMSPFWALPKRRRRRDADATPSWYFETAAEHMATVPALLREAFKQSRRARRDSEAVSMFGAPPSMLNQRITGSRRFAAESYSLSRIRALAQAFDATVNDAVLAICGSALRGYLLSHDALPERPLVAMVPMSMRKDDTAGGNLFAVILANLGTHLKDPAQRMQVIKSSVQEAKTRYAQMSTREAINYSALMLTPVFYNLLTGLKPKWQSFNVVISNVPGPSEPLYMNGARMQGIYPVSMVLDHNALNLTLTSYVDELQFGIVGCRRTVPSMQRLLQHLEQGIVELERAAGIRSPTRERAQRPALYLQSAE